MSSILTDTKKVLGLTEDDTSFDADVILAINDAFSTLNQIGVGPTEGFAILDSSADWSSFIVDSKLLATVQTYIWRKSRLLFDPPTTSFAIKALEDQIAQYEWRLNVFGQEESA